MKKLTLQSVAAMLIAVLISFSSCSKEGPEGPQGPAGPAGPTGATGPAGAPGPAGTANVIYSPWIDVTFEEGGAEINAPQLTADILNNGDIKTYWNLGTPDEPFIVPIPTVVPISFLVETPAPNQPDIYIDPYYTVGSILLSCNYEFEGQIRYILIPGGTQASGRKTDGGVDWNDYNSVKKYLNLKD